LEEVLLATLRSQTAAVASRVAAFGAGGHDLRFAPKELISVNLVLPEGLFDFPETATRYDFRQEQIGTLTTSTGGCCPDQITTPEYGDVTFRVLELPNAAKLAERWMTGIGENEGKLWTALVFALKSASQHALAQHLELVGHAESCILLAVSARRSELESAGAVDRDYWEGVEAGIVGLEEGVSTLAFHAGK
jgi:hypothetical protein